MVGIGRGVTEPVEQIGLHKLGRSRGGLRFLQATSKQVVAVVVSSSVRMGLHATDEVGGRPSRTLPLSGTGRLRIHPANTFEPLSAITVQNCTTEAYTSVMCALMCGRHRTFCVPSLAVLGVLVYCGGAPGRDQGHQPLRVQVGHLCVAAQSAPPTTKR